MRKWLAWIGLTAIALGWLSTTDAANNFLKTAGIAFNSAGTTYITYDTPSACYTIYRLGVLSGQLCNGYIVPPDCPSDLTSITGPGECNDSNGYRVKRDAEGLWRNVSGTWRQAL